jgi:hypothetical protein
MTDLEKLRANALANIDRARRNFLAAFWAAILFEGLFTLGILYFADFKNTLHLLILCCTGVIYMPVILGLVALGAYVDRAVLRVLARMDQS